MLSDFFKDTGVPNFTGANATLGAVVAGLLGIAFYIGTFMAFFWLTWAAFQYLVARGNKEELAKARGRIIWALVGLVVIVMAYTFAKYASEIFPAKNAYLPF